MSLPFKDENLTTQNPFIDLLLYNLKILSYNCIIKDMNEADNNETTESLRNGELYISCVENHVEFDMFNSFKIPKDLLIEAGLTPEQMWLYDNFKDTYYIPDEYRPNLTKLLRQWYMDTYIEDKELNPYYRKLVGMPPHLDDWGIPIREFEYLLPEGLEYDNKYVYFHELPNDVIKDLDDQGILDIILEQYPDHDYLRYKTYDISLYDARKKLDLQILYTPPADESITQEFTTRYLQNRKFLLENVYSYSMEIFQSNYHDVMMIFLIISVMCDILAEVQSHIIKKDILDRRCIEFIFSMYGVPYYKVIPLKYQVKICRNIHNLVKYKSSTTLMLDLISLFDPKDDYNINIMKYYILKNRKTDAYGNYVWASKKILKGNHNDIIEEEHDEINVSDINNPLPIPKDVDIYEKIQDINNGNTSTRMYSIGTKTNTINDDKEVIKEVLNVLADNTTIYYDLPSKLETIEQQPKNVRYVKYPFDYFLQKGNVMFIRLDGRVLQENVDYTISNYNKITFTEGLLDGKKNITYDFYYDKTTIDQPFTINTENAAKMVIKSYANTSVIDLNPLPFIDYFSKGNDIIVSIGSVFLHPSMYKVSDDNILYLDKSLDIVDRKITVIYIYAKKLKTRYEKHIVKAATNGQRDFYVPEPFIYYLENENQFFVNIGTTFVDANRYQIYISKNEGESFIRLDEATAKSITKDRMVVFNFLYSANSIINKIELLQESITLTATSDYQTVFDVKYPVSHYVKCRYKYYVKYLGNYLPETWYTITDTTLVIINESLALQKGNQLELVLVYVDKDRTEEKYSNVLISSTSILATSDNMSQFTIKFPVEHYNTKFNKVILDIQGTLLVEGTDYNLDYDTGKIKLLRRRLYLSTNQTLNITFIYNGDAEYVISLKTQTIPITKLKNPTFDLSFPFYPYLQTGQDFLTIIGTTLVDKSRISMINQFDMQLEADLTEAGREITVMFIYNTWYIKNGQPKLIVEWKPVYSAPSDIDEDYLDVPVPFQYYIENDWDYFVTYGDRMYMDDNLYEVFNNSFYTIPPQYLRDKKYGDWITFVFVYLLKPPYTYYEEVEDYENTTDLVFCKIPLDDLYSTPYLKENSRYKKYDGFVKGDGWWDGVNYKQNYHDTLKHEIYEQKWNYARTKYYQTVQIIDIAKYSAQISYFYSMLYDDVLLEEQLLIKVDSLSHSHKFKLAHLFIFMTVLTYIYNGIEDFIIDNPAKNLVVSGFNFKTSLDIIKEYLRKKHRQQSDFNVWDMIIPTEQIKDMVEFMNIYKTDLNIRRNILHNMLDADDYEEYKVWKDIYDSLMTWKLTMKYFTLSNGKLAYSYTEFLEDQDIVLYNIIQKVKSIKDETVQMDTIIGYIDDIIYVLDEWMDEYPYIFDQFAGHSGTDLMKYLQIMIDFFKSYKIVFLTRNTQIEISWGDDRDEDLLMRPLDSIYIHEITNQIEYYPVIEDISSTELDQIEDNEVLIKDDIIITQIGGKQVEIKQDFTQEVLDCSITVKPIEVNITIIQSDHQRISITVATKTYTESFKTVKGSQYTITITAEEGYNPGTLNISNKGTFDKDTTVSATAATVAYYTVTITQKPHQTIIVTANGKEYTSSFQIAPGTTVTAKVTPDKGYSAGTLNQTTAIIAGPTEFTVSDATLILTDLRYYAIKNIPNFETVTTIPQENLDYLNSGLEVTNIDSFFGPEGMPFPLHELDALATIPKFDNMNLSRVTTYKQMYAYCMSATSIDTSYLVKDMVHVTTLESMFYNCRALQSIDTSNWDISNITSLSNVFANCFSLGNINTSNWNTSKVTLLTGLFANCRVMTNIDVSNFDTSKVTDMTQVFLGCKKVTNLNVSNWNTSNVTGMYGIFDGCSELQSLDLHTWDVSKVLTMDHLFTDCTSITSINISGWKTTSCISMVMTFFGLPNIELDISNWDTSNVTDMRYIFGSIKRTSINVPNWNTSKVTNMYMAFCSMSIETIDISNWDTSNVTDMRYMFGYNAVDAIDPTKVTSTQTPLTTIKGIIDMKSCTKYDRMFADTPNLIGVKIKNPPFNPNDDTAKAKFESDTHIKASQYTIVS